jgi:ribose 5-phosphate isomerase B
MRVGFTSDHAGYELKERLKAWAQEQGHVVVDFGADGLASVDYPDFAHRAAAGNGTWERLVLVCGSGVGISIAANRHACIRCALVTSNEHARLSRQHNNANAIAMGQRFTDFPQAVSYLKIFLETEFEGGRHQKRVEKIDMAGDI